MNRPKMKALVHYVIAKSDPVRLGAVRLNKILWFADTFAYRATGVSMTGETYIKRPRGPVPQHIVGIIKELEGEGAILVRERDIIDYPIREYIGVTDPDTTNLSAHEIRVVDQLRQHICENHTAASISDLSHTRVWDAANLGEEIPMLAVLASASGEISHEVVSWADRIVDQIEAVRLTTMPEAHVV